MHLEKKLLYSFCLIFLLASSIYYNFRSTSLDDVDSVNYALGVIDYDLSKHQPHPPGAPIYVFISKIFHYFGLSCEQSLVLISNIGGGLFISAWFIIMVSNFGYNKAYITTLAIALLNGVWMTATKPMSDSLSAALIAIVVLFINEYTRQKKENLLYYVAFFGAIATGIRPQFAPLIIIIFLSGMIIHLCKFRTLIISFIIFNVTCLSWFIPTLLSQISVNENGNFFSYFIELNKFSNIIKNTSEWSLTGDDIDLFRILKRIFIHLSGCLYLSMGFNFYYPDQVNNFLSKFGTRLHPWNPDIIEWTISGTLFTFLSIFGLIIYIKSKFLNKESHSKFWKTNFLWPIFHFGLMVYSVPPSNRQYLPILPILLIPAILGLFTVGKFKKLLLTMFILSLAFNSIPLALSNHFELPPPVRLLRYLEHYEKSYTNQKYVFILGSNCGRHAQWYVKDCKANYTGKITEAELQNYLSKNLKIFTDRKHYFDENFPNYRLEPLKVFQRSIRIWNRHNKIILYEVHNDNL